ncbi:hypothetical protein BH23BAC4_BH23BAC4_16290 [soil metagenome]
MKCRHGLRPITTFLAGLLVVLSASSVRAQTPALQPDVRVRLGYFAVWGDQRDGSFRQDHLGQGRVQAGLTWRAAPAVRLQARLATRFSTTQEAFRFRTPDYQPGPEGLAPGDIALDQLFATWQPAASSELRAGRMQLAFPLPDVLSKSLQRNDGPNVDDHWVDALHARTDLPGVGRAHLALIHTSRAGVATAFRPPLTFDGESSRAALFAVLEGRAPVGLLVHRAIHLTVLPRALPDADGTRSAYLAASMQGAVALPLSEGFFDGSRVMVAGEVGWTPTTPTNSRLRLPGTGHAGGAAGQLSVNLLSLADGAHDLGLYAGIAEPGWLLSPDIRPNNFESEARYYWRFARNQRLDLRIRRRSDLVAPEGSVQRRTEWDSFLRYNVRF